jgi:ring-1,2-phenylacetyl-CoA epoxidase subunit PaaA
VSDPRDEAILKQRVQNGYLIETPEEMTDGYRAALRTILTVSADTELMSAPAYYLASQGAPSTNAQITALAIIQDELGHAHIAYSLLEELGESQEYLVYERPAKEFKHPYSFDMPLRTWTELVTANALWDRAGYVLLGDVHEHTSYGPWKRALAKVDKEEFFHLRQGENWFRILSSRPDTRQELQKTVDWMFPLTVEWFGLPDAMKRHSAQLDYRLKGLTNDQLRQQWMSTAVPLCEKHGIRVPAHKDEESGEYVVEFTFPCQFDAGERHWYFEHPISWDDVLERWKARGPMNEEYVGAVRRGYQDLMARRRAS